VESHRARLRLRLPVPVSGRDHCSGGQSASPCPPPDAHVDCRGAGHLSRDVWLAGPTSPCRSGRPLSTPTRAVHDTPLLFFHIYQRSTLASPPLSLVLPLSFRESMAMWRAAARQLVDRAIGSRAAHVMIPILPPSPFSSIVAFVYVPRFSRCEILAWLFHKISLPILLLQLASSMCGYLGGKNSRKTSDFHLLPCEI
jgi:hypothetical protein